MTNLMLSFEVVAPLLILMLLGGFLRKVKALDTESVNKMNKLVFNVFLPVMIFNNVYTSSIEDIKSIKPAIFAASVLSVGFLVAMVIVPFLEKDNKKRGVMVQGMCRSNFVIYGLPLALSLCGQGVMGKVSVEVTVVIPVINVFSIIALEFFRGGRIDVKKTVKGILTNPLLISSVLGILMLLSGIKFPAFINGSLDDIGGITTPLSLIILGASINFSAVKKNLKPLMITLLGKLVIVPVVGLSIAVLMGFPKEDIAVFIAAFAAPTAVSSFPMAQQTESDTELAAQIVAFSTAISIVTVFFLVFFLKQMNLI